jgi:hypothetical protein
MELAELIQDEEVEAVEQDRGRALAVSAGLCVEIVDQGRRR